MSAEPDDDRPGYPAERVKAFADAVVAIAMTLLILPLLESVTSAASAGENAAGWLAVDLAMVTLFLVALVVAIAVPAIGYYALFLLMLTSVVERVFDRMLRTRPIGVDTT